MITASKSKWLHSLVPAACLVVLNWGAVGDDKPAAAAPGGKLPPAKEVIAKFVQAIGGRDAILKHNSMGLKGKWEVPNMGQSGDFEMVRSKPNRQLLRIKFGDQGQMVNGYDGKVGWTLSPFTGAVLLEGQMLEQTMEEAEFYSILHDDQNFKSMETVGTSQLDGKECVELKLTTKAGREVHEFFDSKTGLLVGTRGTQESLQGPNLVTIILSDYKKMGDLLQATRYQVKAGEFEQLLTISSVDYDAVADKEFVLPDEIKALLKK